MSRLQQQLLQAPAPQELTAQLTFPFPALDPPSLPTNSLTWSSTCQSPQPPERVTAASQVWLQPKSLRPVVAGPQNVQPAAGGRPVRSSSVQCAGLEELTCVRRRAAAPRLRSNHPQPPTLQAHTAVVSSCFSPAAAFTWAASTSSSSPPLSLRGWSSPPPS